MIVTIDGPAGAGKSSVARQLAERLGFEFLDTGAMYRAVTYAALDAGIDLDDVMRLTELAARVEIELSDGRVSVDGVDVSDAIRTPEVTRQIRFVADPPAIRRVLVERQRQWVAERNVVTEGRDQGTVAFPHAGCKIFLTASPEVRARRRYEQLNAAGVEVDEPSILAQQIERDHRDSTRTEGALRAADDAIEVVTDGLTMEQVIDRLVQIVRERSAARS